MANVCDSSPVACFESGLVGMRWKRNSDERRWEALHVFFFPYVSCHCAPAVGDVGGREASAWA